MRPAVCGTGSPFAMTRIIFLIGGAIGLLAGLWGGLARLGLVTATPDASVVLLQHGGLMVSGFLGTLISLERAVALGKWPAFLAPASCGTGTLLLVTGFSTSIGLALIALASLVFVGASTWIAIKQPAAFTLLLLLGALAWLVANLLWLWGLPIAEFVPLWMLFLLLTILGERLELSRLLRNRPASMLAFWCFTLFAISGTIIRITRPDLLTPVGVFTLGAGFLGLAAWLVFFDVARRTVRQSGRVGFIAAALLGGYAWLGAAGLLIVVFALPGAGPAYDAILHSFFVGFVFAMIFGHAPIVFPAVLGNEIRFTRLLYMPLALLHGTLIVRLAGDLFDAPALRQWGAAGNALCIALFLALFAGSAILTKRRSSGGGGEEHA